MNRLKLICLAAVIPASISTPVFASLPDNQVSEPVSCAVKVSNLCIALSTYQKAEVVSTVDGYAIRAGFIDSSELKIELSVRPRDLELMGDAKEAPCSGLVGTCAVLRTDETYFFYYEPPSSRNRLLVSVKAPQIGREAIIFVERLEYCMDPHSKHKCSAVFADLVREKIPVTTDSHEAMHLIGTGEQEKR